MSLPNVKNRHNLNGNFIGTAEVRFCEGATTLAQAQALGFRDLGNLKVVTPSTNVKIEEHKGSYRGLVMTDKQQASSADLMYSITGDEWNHKNVAIIFGGTAGTSVTQSASASSPGDTLDTLVFTALAPSTSEKDYAVLKSAVQIYGVSEVTVYGPLTTCTGANTGDVITATAHGLANGQQVLISGAGVAAGLTAGTTYFVVSVTTNTFQLSATSGGSAIFLTSDSTAMAFSLLQVDGTNYTIDPQLGKIRFLTTQVGNVTVKAVFPAIVQGDVLSFVTIVPMDNVVRQGFAEITIYDQDDTEAIVFWHQPFKCNITTKKIGDANGSSWADFELSLLVDPNQKGVMLTRGANGQLA